MLSFFIRYDRTLDFCHHPRISLAFVVVHMLSQRIHVFLQMSKRSQASRAYCVNS